MHNITSLKCSIQSKKIENKRTVITTIWKTGLSLVKKITVPKNAKVITLLFLSVCIACAACMYESKKNALNFRCIIKGVVNKKKLS